MFEMLISSIGFWSQSGRLPTLSYGRARHLPLGYTPIKQGNYNKQSRLLLGAKLSGICHKCCISSSIFAYSFKTYYASVITSKYKKENYGRSITGSTN